MRNRLRAFVSSGVPHLPAPKDPKRVSEKRCSGCGCWNHPEEIRCHRCGRKLEAMLGASARRELEENESLPGPTIPIAATPKPEPEPEWKQELNRRLAGYRERKAERGEDRDGREAARMEAESAPLPPPNGSQGDRPTLPPPNSQPDVSPLPPVRIQDTADALNPEVVGKPRPQSAPVFDQYIEAQSRLPQRPKRPQIEELLAPIGKRMIAGLLDLCVVALALAVFVAVTHLMNEAIFRAPGGLGLLSGAFAVLLVFYWAAYLRLMGSTPGMHWTGLRVLNLDGEPPDAQQRWTRTCGTVLSAAAMGVGFLWSLFDEQHFTWHDRLSKTFVANDD